MASRKDILTYIRNKTREVNCCWQVTPAHQAMTAPQLTAIQ
jgi:hypothetical protein